MIIKYFLSVWYTRLDKLSPLIPFFVWIENRRIRSAINDGAARSAPALSDQCTFSSIDLPPPSHSSKPLVTLLALPFNSSLRHVSSYAIAAQNFRFFSFSTSVPLVSDPALMNATDHCGKVISWSDFSCSVHNLLEKHKHLKNLEKNIVEWRTTRRYSSFWPVSRSSVC